MPLRIRRYSPTHVAAQVTIAGRGLYVTRTADGLWWRVRLRRACPPVRCGDLPDEPFAGAGSREPRRPNGPAPFSAAVRLDPPG
jgi:hypothetical protein